MKTDNTSRRHQAARLLALSLLASGGLASIVGSGGGGGGSPPPPDNQSPIAVAALSGESVANATTTFSTTGTRDPDGTIASRSWAYGDGQTGSADTHTYTAPGSFTATYTVTDNQGATASTTVAVTVKKCSTEGSRLAALAPAASATVCVQTSAGEMVFEVLTVNAPITAANFLQYVTEGFYSGTLIHRIERDFVIQGGGYTTGLAPKAPTHAAITLESQNGLSNQQYTLAMARGTDPNSATSQFFVNVFDNSATLDYKAGAGGRDGYAVFGQVIAGTAVVDALNGIATTTSGGLQNVPVNEVVIRGMIRLP